MGNLINKFTNKCICFYCLFNIRGVLKQRPITSGRRGRKKVKNHWLRIMLSGVFKGSWARHLPWAPSRCFARKYCSCLVKKRIIRSSNIFRTTFRTTYSASKGVPNSNSNVYVEYSAFKGPPTTIAMCRYSALRGHLTATSLC